MPARTSVLLVEDNADDARLIERALSRSQRIKFEVARARSVADAREQLGRSKFDAVVADLGLPDSDGLATFEAVHAKAGGAAVVVLTGDDREELGLKAVELGAQEYIVKTERAFESLPIAVAYAVERARREEEIRELTTALMNTVDAIATVDETGVCVAIDAAFQALFGFEERSFVGSVFIDFIHEADRVRVIDGFAVRKGMQEIEARTVRKDGRIVPIQLSLVARGGNRGFFCFVRDLTRQKQLEGKVAAAAAITAVGSLATGLAHEVNNPLAVVLANVEEANRVLEEAEPSFPENLAAEMADVRSMLTEAHSASQRVQFIIRDLRVFACADERRARVDVNAILESCCNIAFAEIRHRARLSRDLQTIAPVLGIEAKLAQVFLNLLINAAHAVPEDTVDRNEILVATRQVDRTQIVVEISDTGAGIAPGQAGQVFEPFFTTKPRRPGMGLTICQATMAAHGGDIAIQARAGGGTTVRLTLPTFEAELAERQLGAEAGVAQQRRVLVVDDDPLVLRSLTRVLARDFEVSAARNGREALDLVRAGGAFDAMLCDLMMPELSGIELHELLERDAPELAKRTIFLTGGAFSGRAQTFLEAVGQPHLEKPVDLKTVRDLLLELSSQPTPDRASGKWLGGT